MITEDYVSFETAKLLKEKGFDEATYHDYDENGRRWFQEVLVNHNSQGGVACPTLQMAMKWLRKVHNLFIFISTWLMHEDGTVQYYYEIRNLNDEDFKTIRSCTITEFDSYEKICETAIKYCLKNLI